MQSISVRYLCLATVVLKSCSSWRDMEPERQEWSWIQILDILKSISVWFPDLRTRTETVYVILILESYLDYWFGESTFAVRKSEPCMRNNYSEFIFNLSFTKPSWANIVWIKYLDRIHSGLQPMEWRSNRASCNGKAKWSMSSMSFELMKYLFRQNVHCIQILPYDALKQRRMFD